MDEAKRHRLLDWLTGRIHGLAEGMDAGTQERLQSAAYFLSLMDVGLLELVYEDWRRWEIEGVSRERLIALVSQRFSL